MFKPEVVKKEKSQTEDENYQKEVISLIHENLKNLASGGKLDPALGKLLDEGEEITEILNNIGKKDLIPFLQEYKKKTDKVPLAELPDHKLLISLVKSKNYQPQMIELGLILDKLKVKLNRDIIQDILQRDFMEKELSSLGSPKKLHEMEVDRLQYSHAFDETLGLLYQKGKIAPELESLSIRGQKEIKESKFKYDGISQGLMKEILKISNKDYEYKDMDESQYKEIWDKLEKLNNDIEIAQKQEIKPKDFFTIETLLFLKDLFGKRLEVIEDKFHYRNKIEKEYADKYYV
jgi:hypothetical protein